jgi:hypothetical protein
LVLLCGVLPASCGCLVLAIAVVLIPGVAELLSSMDGESGTQTDMLPVLLLSALLCGATLLHLLPARLLPCLW